MQLDDLPGIRDPSHPALWTKAGTVPTERRGAFNVGGGAATAPHRTDRNRLAEGAFTVVPPGRKLSRTRWDYRRGARRAVTGAP